MAIQHGMDGTFGWAGNTGEPTQQALTDFASTPAGVLVLYVQDEVFHLERKSVGVAIRASASVRQPLHAAFLITIEDLIAGLAGEMPNSLQSSAIASPASRRATNCSLSSIAEHSFQGITPYPYGEKVSPMCPVQCVTYVSGRSVGHFIGVLRNQTRASQQSYPAGDVVSETRRRCCIRIEVRAL